MKGSEIIFSNQNLDPLATMGDYGFRVFGWSWSWTIGLIFLMIAGLFAWNIWLTWKLRNKMRDETNERS